MEKDQVLTAIAKSKENSPKRKFNQSFDLIINLKGLDPKKPEHQVDTFVNLPHARGKKLKVCALVGAELSESAKSTCDMVIMSDDFVKYTDKREVKKIASAYDFFIAQANIMPKVATAFGRALGPRGKMPNPKSGCIVPPNANLKPLYEKLQRTIRLVSKAAPLIQCAVGTEDMNDSDIAENILAVYKSLLQALPNEKHNVKDAYLKLTMGKPIRIDEKIEVVKETK